MLLPNVKAALILCFLFYRNQILIAIEIVLCHVLFHYSMHAAAKFQGFSDFVGGGGGGGRRLCGFFFLHVKIPYCVQWSRGAIGQSK